MSFEHYIRSGNRLLRCGYTTGSCAALAALGAARLLLGSEKAGEGLAIAAPKGLEVRLEKGEYEAGLSEDGSTAWCSVKKDAGDDADVTDGLEIRAEVSRRAGPEAGETPGKGAGERFLIDGGKGVGRVTKPGLDQGVGAAAINSVPRRMIAEAAARACVEAGYEGGLKIIISAEGGEEIAKRTFNPQLGVVGGISIIGTSGIVEPMSEQALIDTVEVNLRQARAESDRLILTPGNYGERFIAEHMGGSKEGCVSLFSGREATLVKCSNFIGEALDMAALCGFKSVILIAHIGKLVKLAAGVMNTHSRYADARLEVFTAHAAMLGADSELARELMNAATTDACIEILDGRRGRDFRLAVIKSIMEAVQSKLEMRVKGAYEVGSLMFSNEYGFLGASGEAEKELLPLYEKLLKEQ